MRLPIRIACFASLSLISQAIVLSLGIATAQDGSTDRLEHYLAELRLNRLVVEHLEGQVARELDRDKRINLAQRLMTFYTEELLDAQSDPASSTRLAEKANALVNVYPGLNSSRFKIAILHARYLDAERNFFKTRRLLTDEYDPTHARQSNGRQLAVWPELARDLRHYKEQLELRFQELVTALQAGEDDSTSNQQLAQIENQILHVDFLSGWTNYFCGVLDTANQKHWLMRSDECFRDFFQIESRKSLTEFSEKWFDFSSDWQVRGLIGLALCQLGLNHPQQSKHCLDLIEQSSSLTQRQSLPVWRLNSHLYLGRFESALRYVQKYERENQRAEPSQVSFWTTTLESSLLLSQQSSELTTAFERAGLMGLTRNLQAPLIEKYLVLKHPLSGSVTTPRLSQAVSNHELLSNDFFGNWVRGYLAFYRTESNTSVTQQTIHETFTPAMATLTTARNHLELAIAQADARVTESDLARCQFLLATIDFRERSFETAAERFKQVSTTLTPTDRSLAAEAQWIAAQSLLEFSRNKGRQSTQAYSALDNLVRRFPESEFAKRAEFEKLRLNLSTLPDEEAIRRLARIDANNMNYPSAMMEIAKHQFKRCLASIDAGESEIPLRLAELIASVQNIRNQRNVPNELQMASTLMAVDALLRIEPMDHTAIQDNLEFAATSSQLLRTPMHELVAEYRYYEMQFADKSKRVTDAKRQANWILENAANTRFEMQALIYLGQRLEADGQQWDRASDEWLQESLVVYRRLVEILGSDVERLQKSKNAQVALAKLAELESKAAQFLESSAHYQILVDGFPNQQRYLHGLAQANMRLEKYESAAQLWRRLSANAQAGTDAWYEAKHELIVCLLDTDRIAGEQLYRQTMRLSPELPANWRQKYAELATRCQE